MDAFEHESLEVYQVAMEFAVLADKLTRLFAPGRAYVSDRLNREATALVLNVATGSGETQPVTMARYLRRARRRASRCAALLDLARTMKQGDEGQIAAGRGLLMRIVALLVEMGNKLDRAISRSDRGDAPSEERGES